MAFNTKIAFLFALVACVAAFPHGGHVEVDYPHAYPKYEFSYGVTDHHTGDMKSQKEQRDGDHVTGSYSLAEPDGHILTVHYAADKHSGYNAHLYRNGHPVLPPVAPPLVQTKAFKSPLGHGHGFIQINHQNH